MLPARISAAVEVIEYVVEDVLNDSCRTGDIWQEGGKKVGTAEMGDRIIEKMMS